jgi:hypothetical protein
VRLGAVALYAEKGDRAMSETKQTYQQLEQELEVWRHGPSCWSCGDSGDVHQLDGEWLGKCDCVAAQLIDVTAERDRMKSEVEALRKDAFFHRHAQRQAELYQNVQMAAGSLPDGWQVVIEIERDAGTVSLLDADGEAVDEEFGDSGDLADQVAEALKYAVSKEGEQ